MYEVFLDVELFDVNPLVLELFDVELFDVEPDVEPDVELLEVPGNVLVVVLLELLDLKMDEELDLVFELPKDLEKDDLLPEILNPFALIPIVEVKIKTKIKKTANILLFTKTTSARIPLTMICIFVLKLNML